MFSTFLSRHAGSALLAALLSAGISSPGFADSPPAAQAYTAEAYQSDLQQFKDFSAAHSPAVAALFAQIDAEDEHAVTEAQFSSMQLQLEDMAAAVQKLALRSPEAQRVQAELLTLMDFFARYLAALKTSDIRIMQQLDAEKALLMQNLNDAKAQLFAKTAQ